MLSDLDRRLAELARAQYGLFTTFSGPRNRDGRPPATEAHALAARSSDCHRTSFASPARRAVGISGCLPQPGRAATTAACRIDPPPRYTASKAFVPTSSKSSTTSGATTAARHDVIVHVTSVLDAADRGMVWPDPRHKSRANIDRSRRGARESTGSKRRSTAPNETATSTARSLITRHAQIRQSGRNGVGVLAELLDRRHATAAMPQSVLERRMLRLLEGAGLAEPACQLRVPRADGRTAFLDLAYPQIRLGIELDGHAWHSTKRQRQRDNERQNQVVLSDWKILRFTYEDVTQRPEYVANVVRHALVTGAATRSRPADCDRLQVLMGWDDRFRRVQPIRTVNTRTRRRGRSLRGR